jgi:predicted permease
MRAEHWLYTIPLRLRSLFLRKRVEAELDEELADHLERATETYLARGLSPSAARAAAIRDMDGLTQQKEACRDTRRIAPIDNTFRDVRFGLRVLLKSPGSTCIAILTLALAIAANAVVFGVLNGLFLRPLNVPEPESLYGIEHSSEHNMWESYPDYLDLRDRNTSFDGLAGFSIDMVGLDTGNSPTRAWISPVTGNYFDVLRIQPHLGRFFHAADEHGPNSAPYIVLAYKYWRSHFDADPSVIGRIVRVNKHPYTIIGVAPPDFRGAMLFGLPDFFVPFINQREIEGRDTLNVRNTHSLFMLLGHLKPGVSPQQAAADLSSIGAWIGKTYPKDHGATSFVLARPGLYGNLLAGPTRAFVGGLMLLATLILLAACANLGSLFGARAADRAREVALRLALGATRARILRQFLTEAVIVSLCGGALGLWGSVALLHAISAWRPFPRFPSMDIPVQPVARVYLIALALALVSGLLFGVVPVRQVLRANPYQVVKAGPSGAIGRGITFRDILLLTQIAICAVLVTASLVAVRGLDRTLHNDFGFGPHNVLLAETDLNIAGYTGDRVPEMQRRLIDAMAAIPGVDAAATIGRVPLSGGGFAAAVYAENATDLTPGKALAWPERFNVSPNYFRAAGTPLLAGRAFTWHDDKDAPQIAVINRETARRLFGSAANPIGAHFKLRDGSRVEVVGLVETGKYQSLTEDPAPAIYLPVLQSPMSETVVLVRSRRDRRQVAAAVQIAIHGIDPTLPYLLEPWEQELDLALFPSRIATVALGLLGVMGAILSITGIFGMAAYSVSKRMRELGIRIALGAQRTELLQAALGRALRLLAMGSAAGLIFGILAGKVLAAIVYQATPKDPLVLGGVLVSMLILGLLGTWIPAQRALSLDAITLLREE